MKCCDNCTQYIDGYCWKDVNNFDPDLLVPERDSREPEDVCDDWEFNEMSEV